jgi:cell division septation protein DedD
VLPNPITTPTPAASTQGPPTTTAAIPSIAPAAPAIASGPNEPKKVRTVTIKPDQPSALDSLSARSAAVQTPASRVAGAPPSQGALSNTPQAAASMRVASAPPNVKPVKPEPSIAGGFMVQVSSQKSEADAKASYKTLQAKFPTQLQNRSAVIRRADISGKGTFYRAQVGPFTSSDQANEFCKTLQVAGGQCMVQKN